MRLDFPEAFDPMMILNEAGSKTISRKLLKFVTAIEVIGMKKTSCSWLIITSPVRKHAQHPADLISIRCCDTWYEGAPVPSGPGVKSGREEESKRASFGIWRNQGFKTRRSGAGLSVHSCTFKVSEGKHKPKPCISSHDDNMACSTELFPGNPP